MSNTNAQTSNFGIIGYPLGHTLSPVFQNAALQHCGIQDQEFQAWQTHSDQLEAKVRSFRDKGFIAACVTLPHKQAVMPLIDQLHETAQAVGAVNWIINENGKLIGHNTDSPGFIRALTEIGKFQPQGKNAIVFGAGGAARAIIHALKNSGVASITIANRTLANAQKLAETFSDDKLQPTAIMLDAQSLQTIAPQADLLVNTTSIGMAGGPAPEESPIQAHLISPNAVAYDAVYAPPMTPFLKEAEKAGATPLGGLTMLVLQGAVGFELAFQKPAPVPQMFHAIEEATRS